jgi:hypothetical protein
VEHEHRIIDEELLFRYRALAQTVRDGSDPAYDLGELDVALAFDKAEQGVDPLHHIGYVRKTLAELEVLHRSREDVDDSC